MSKILNVYLHINMVKNDVDSQIMKNFEKFDLGFFYPFANICCYLFTLKKYLVYLDSDLTCLISKKWIHGLCQLFCLSGLTFKFWIWRWNKIYHSYLLTDTCAHSHTDACTQSHILTFTISLSLSYTHTHTHTHI